MLKVLFVTKDEGPTHNAVRVAQELQTHHVYAVAEGLSIPVWEKAGIPLLFKGAADFKKDPFEANEYALLREVKPNVVVTTLSNPINLEDRFSRATNGLQIPLVWLQDTWGVENRSGALPQLICAIDNMAERTILVNPKFKNDPPKIEIVGNLAMEDLLKEVVPETSQKRIANLKAERGYTVFLAGQGSYTDDVIRVVRGCIAQSSKPCVVIPWLHKKYREEQKQYLDLFKKDEIIEIPESEIPLRHLAALCDATIAVFSTLLPVAAYFKKVPISVLTPLTQEGMIKSTGLDRYPLCTTGAVVEITEPRDLSTLIQQETGKERITITPFSAAKAARAIIECAKQHIS